MVEVQGPILTRQIQCMYSRIDFDVAINLLRRSSLLRVSDVFLRFPIDRTKSQSYVRSQ